LISQRFPQLKGVIIDMDGVLWRNTDPIGDLPAIFTSIEAQGLQWICATNNATQSPEEFAEKLRGFGVETHPGCVVNSASATVDYLKSNFSLDSKVYVVGSESLWQMVSDAGFETVPTGDEEWLERAAEIDIVVAGLDRRFSYNRMRDAAMAIRLGATFIATNTDATYPTPQGLLPGAGAAVRAIEVASGKEPMVIGKPNPMVYQEALKRMGLEAAQVMGIGDRLDTDIRGAQAAGCLSGLVLTGVTSIQAAKAWQPPLDAYAPDLWSLVND